MEMLKHSCSPAEILLILNVVFTDMSRERERKTKKLFNYMHTIQLDQLIVMSAIE